MHRCKKVTPLAAVLGICLAASAGFAQDDAESPNRAERYYVAAGKTYNIHANDHARMLGKYAAAAGKPVPGDVIREHTAEIEDNVAHARKSFAKLSTVAKSNPAIAKQLAEIEKQLTNVTTSVNHLKSASKDDTAEASMVMSEAAAISKSLKATHLASKEIDQALSQSISKSDQFENIEKPSYYFTGEGHFID